MCGVLWIAVSYDCIHGRWDGLGAVGARESNECGKFDFRCSWCRTLFKSSLAKETRNRSIKLVPRPRINGDGSLILLSSLATSPSISLQCQHNLSKSRPLSTRPSPKAKYGLSNNTNTMLLTDAVLQQANRCSTQKVAIGGERLQFVVMHVTQIQYLAHCPQYS